MTKPREKAVRKIADNYNSMSPEQQERAAEMVQRIVKNDPNFKDKKLENEQKQEALVQEVAPKLVDILNELGTDYYQGKRHTIEFNKEENKLSLIENETEDSLMMAEWHPDEGEWENHGSSLTEYDRNQIQKAWEWAEDHHQNQKDKEAGLER
jgi:hypothetical protein